MARRICQLYDTFATGTGNDRISRISVLQTLFQRKRVALSLNRWAAWAGGPPVWAARLTWLLSVCHKVIIEDVARLDTRRDAVRDNT